MKARLLVYLLVVFVGVGALWTGLRRTQVSHTGAEAANQLIVGTNVGYPPFILADECGKPVGFDVDVACAIAAHIGCEASIRDMAFDALLFARNQGTVDMIIGGISITKERGDLISYHGDMVDRVALFYQPKSSAAGMTLTQLAQSGLRVCTQSGTVFEQILESYEGIRLKTLPDISDLTLEIIYGTCDVCVLDPDTVRTLARNLASHEATLTPDQRIAGFGIGVTPHKPELRERIAQAVAALKQDGTLKRLADKWFGSQEKGA